MLGLGTPFAGLPLACAFCPLLLVNIPGGVAPPRDDEAEYVTCTGCPVGSSTMTRLPFVAQMVMPESTSPYKLLYEQKLPGELFRKKIPIVANMLHDMVAAKTL